MLVCSLTFAPLGHHPLPETAHELGQMLRDLLQFAGDLIRHWQRR
jgi:hypothetical protein